MFGFVKYIIPYEKDLSEILERSKVLIQRGLDPRKVAEVVERALRDRHPRPVYRVGFSAGLMGFLSLLPATWFDSLFSRMAARTK